MTFSRRHFLGILTAFPVGVLAGCGAAGSETLPATAPTSPRSRAPAPAADTPAEQEHSAPAPLAAEASVWVPGPGEVSPEVKRAAAAFLETAGTWVAGAGAAASLAAAGARLEVASTASPLEMSGAESSTVHIVYPQYGGLEGGHAAVITLFDQETELGNGARASRQLALDLRLAQTTDGTWEVQRINPLTSLGAPVPLSAAAQSVLTDSRIQLSGPATLDVSTGRMSDALLSVLLGLADTHTIGVQVMHTGHIQTVFPYDRVSNHAVGRAVDVRTVDGYAVVSPDMPREVLASFMSAAAELGATEVGGPFDLNGEGRAGFFSDAVHQDHVHIGITPGLARAHLR